MMGYVSKVSVGTGGIWLCVLECFCWWMIIKELLPFKILISLTSLLLLRFAINDHFVLLLIRKLYSRLHFSDLRAESLAVFLRNDERSVIDLLWEGLLWHLNMMILPLNLLVKFLKDIVVLLMQQLMHDGPLAWNARKVLLRWIVLYGEAWLLRLLRVKSAIL